LFVKRTKIKWRDLAVLAITVFASFFLMVFANKNEQNSALHVWTLELAGKVIYPFNRLHEMVHIRDENSRLKLQYIQLQLENSRLYEAKQENKRLLALLEIKQALSFEYIAAKVIGFDGMDGVKSIILNVGNNKGVEKNMPIISENGLAGKICRVSENNAIGQVLMDKNFRVAARLQESRYTGLFEGTGKDQALMWGVPQKAQINIGEDILTSGMNSLFPSGLKIGHVVSFKDDANGLFQLLIVEPDVEYSQLEEVLIIKSRESEK